MELVIRQATPADAALILRFIRALAEFERAPEAVIASEKGLLCDGFAPNSSDFCLIAELFGRRAKDSGAAQQPAGSAP
jgi:hypothetical protein